MEFDYDLFVIGAGSGGVPLSRMAASYGARVAIAEDSHVGGTCVLRGCISKKLLVYASHFPREVGDAAGYGWSYAPGTVSWSTLMLLPEGGARGRYDAVLYATGRQPNSAHLGLEPAGVKLEINGAIEVDGHSATSVPSIHAICDVTAPSTDASGDARWQPPGGHVVPIRPTEAWVSGHPPPLVTFNSLSRLPATFDDVDYR